MAVEIERKYLVDVSIWRPAGAGVAMRQGYLSRAPERVVRVRIEGDRAHLTIKGATRGISRLELEYDIPVADANVLLDDLCERPLIEKTRHREVHGGKTWDIDVFAGDNAGLVLAEIELAAEDEHVDVPAWATTEVSHDPRYYNVNLAKRPFTSWR
jgi:CYTH domain-containing protein